MLFMLPKPANPASPGIPPNGNRLPNGFDLGSKLPNPGMLDRRFAFKPASPANCMFAAALLLLLLLCFFDGVDDDEEDC